MQKLLILITLILSLSNCSIIHQMDIEQGNIITQDMVSRIHPGMSKDDVVAVMGTPVLINTFADNRVEYVYTYKPAHSQQGEKYMILTFQNNRLKDIKSNMK